MRVRTRSSKPKLVPGLGEVVQRKRVEKNVGVEKNVEDIEKLNNKTTKEVSERSDRSYLLESPILETQTEKNLSFFLFGGRRVTRD